MFQPQAFSKTIGDCKRAQHPLNNITDNTIKANPNQRLTVRFFNTALLLNPSFHFSTPLDLRQSIELDTRYRQLYTMQAL